MKFTEAILEYDKGKKIHCDSWVETFYIFKERNTSICMGSTHLRYELISMDDIIHGVWKIIEEPKKKKKVVYYQAVYFSREFFQKRITTFMYVDEKEAKTDLEQNNHIFTRLLTEYPIEIEEEE